MLTSCNLQYLKLLKRDLVYQDSPFRSWKEKETEREGVVYVCEGENIGIQELEIRCYSWYKYILISTYNEP